MIPSWMNENLFDKWIEFEKWKLEKQHAHEIRLKEMELEQAPKRSYSSNKNQVSEVDAIEVLKNKATLFGEDNSSYIGKIARTKLFTRADERAKELSEVWTNYLINERGLTQQDIDKLRPVIRSFYAVAATSQRCCDYPNAKDRDESITWIETIYLKTLRSKPPEMVINAYECVKNTWNEGFDFNVSLIGEFLDELYSSQYKKEVKKKDSEFVNSPLYEKVISDSSWFDDINPDTIESLIYDKNNGNYLAGMVSALTTSLKASRPEFLANEVDEEDWPQLWPQYLGVCKTEWAKEFTPKINLVVLEQKKWEKERHQD